jgi:hypothetical protein
VLFPASFILLFTNKIAGSKRKHSKFSQVPQRNALKHSILLTPSVIKSYLYYKKHGLQCLISESDSLRCSSYVHFQQSNCKAFSLSATQLRRIATKGANLNSELDKAEEAWLKAGKRVKRLRTQKKEWSKKIKRAIKRGIDNLEELERVKRKERKAEAAHQAALLAPNSAVTGPSQYISDIN